MKYLTHRYPQNTRSLWGDFEDFFNAPSPFMSSSNPLLNWNSDSYRPAIDLYEDESNYFVEAELPAFSKKEIDVEVEKDRLILKGSRKEEGKNGKSEISFHRSVLIPNAVKTEKVAAKYENGLLTVTIPKADAIKPLRIEVQS
jgi:HSP20 family protein